MANFNKKLIEWYSDNKRALPWKKNLDPYQIWLSEIILQQTRVEQGLPYYLKFISQYPTIIDFANADIADILKLWEGLGYYSRARNMHITAQNIRDNFDGKFPKSYNELKILKGIGDYTAAAIASFAFGLPNAVVDGNVFRFLARYFGIAIPIDTTIGKKYFQEKAQLLINTKKPGEHNQAMMDFGALICTPKKPKCKDCPFVSECVAYHSNTIEQMPVKSKKLIKKERHLHFFVLIENSKIIIQQRTKNDIWKLLYDFPCMETENNLLGNEYLEMFSNKIKMPQPIIFKQVLTHQKINAYFYKLNSLKSFKDEVNGFQIDLTEIKNYAFPKIILDYLKSEELYLS